MEIVIEEIRKVPEVLSNPPEVSTPKFSKDVLIVEDDLSFSQTLASIIESKGFSVCCVFSVEEFEQCIATSALKVRLVISDYRLGGRNGAEVMRVCGAMIDPIPVIFLTEDSDPKVEASMIQLGTQAFVRKSANPMILLAWILRLLEAPITDRSDEARTLQ
jgi:DNA-binding NtrC family response regulator